MGYGYPETRPRQNISLNILGDVSIISLNFESLFRVKEKSFLSGKVGIGYNHEIISTGWFSLPLFIPLATIPHHFTFNYGKKKHFIELGAGGTLLVNGGNGYYISYPIIGYRFQPEKPKRMNFRINSQFPIIDYSGSDIDPIAVGLSAGVCF